MTTEIAPNRAKFYQSDTSYRRSLSEALLTKVGAQTNFINAYQNDLKEWKLNGPYSVASGISFYDGIAPFWFNSEIVGLSFYNGDAGSTGTTEFDLIHIDENGVNQGSIFSTTPKIDSTSSANTVALQNFVTATDVQPVGTVLGVLNRTTFAEGSVLYMVINQAMTEAKNCGLIVNYRPINASEVL